MGECRPSKATHNELCDYAMNEYERIASEACHWYSGIPKMIEFYRQHGEEIKMGNNIARSDKVNKSLVELHKRVERLMYDAQLDGADMGEHHKEAMQDIDQAMAYVMHIQELLTESRI